MMLSLPQPVPLPSPPPVPLVRAITFQELSTVIHLNCFSPAPNGCEAKYFTIDLDNASSFARLLYHLSPSEGSLTAANGNVDFSHFDQNWLLFVDGGLPAIAVPIAKLPHVSFLGFEPMLHIK